MPADREYHTILPECGLDGLLLHLKVVTVVRMSAIASCWPPTVRAPGL
jgi:hypothetical protein